MKFVATAAIAVEVLSILAAARPVSSSLRSSSSSAPLVSRDEGHKDFMLEAEIEKLRHRYLEELRDESSDSDLCFAKRYQMWESIVVKLPIHTVRKYFLEAAKARREFKDDNFCETQLTIDRELTEKLRSFEMLEDQNARSVEGLLAVGRARNLLHTQILGQKIDPNDPQARKLVEECSHREKDEIIVGHEWHPQHSHFGESEMIFYLCSSIFERNFDGAAGDARRLYLVSLFDLLQSFIVNYRKLMRELEALAGPRRSELLDSVREVLIGDLEIAITNPEGYEANAKRRPKGFAASTKKNLEKLLKLTESQRFKQDVARELLLPLKGVDSAEFQRSPWRRISSSVRNLRARGSLVRKSGTAKR